MRFDHHAFQRATRVASSGLALQLLIFLTLLIFGLTLDDTLFKFASAFVGVGLLVWLGLIIIFHQHKLERLEALEEDELAATRGESSSVFERAAPETHVAARRLAQMHRWLMPGLSVFVAALLAGLAVVMILWLRNDEHEILRTGERGWAVAICLGAAAFSFIYSRFIAGMAKQQAWQNLRGGAAYMVGNALVLLAVAVAIVFRFFERENQPSAVVDWIAWAIPIFMIGLSLEIVLNFILNLYRPRIPGEIPRPAFDSKILSLLATPDSIVRSLNEAVNYQFGFDVTSSWGYQLLLRSFLSLLILGVAAMVLLSMMVIVEPHQHAVRLRGGQIVGNRVYESGVMWKWPWPIETAMTYDVDRIRKLHLTARVIEGRQWQPEDRIMLWDKGEPPQVEGEIDPFLVGASRFQDRGRSRATNVAIVTAEFTESGQAPPAPTPEEQAVENVSQLYSLVDAEIVMQYRIKPQGEELLKYIDFAPDTVARRQNLSERERALKSLALRQVSQRLARLALEDVLSPGRVDLAEDLRQRVQAAMDHSSTGVEVVAIDLPMLRPSGTSAPSFEDLGIEMQNSQQAVAHAQANVLNTFAFDIGDPNLAEQVLAGIDEYNRLRDELGANAPQTIEQRQKVEGLLIEAGGDAAQRIAEAKRDRWRTVMAKTAEAARVRGERAPYLAAPRLYRVRELMAVYKQYLPNIQKYIIAIDPKQLDIDMDLAEISPYVQFSGANEEEMNK